MMKDPDQIRVILEEGFYRTIQRATEGLLEYNQTIWIQTNELVELIMNELFGEEQDEEGIEELCEDMDQFPTEE